MKTVILTGSTVTEDLPFETQEGDWKFTLQGLGGNTFDQSSSSATPTSTFVDVPAGQYVARMWRETVSGEQLGQIAEATFEFTENPATRAIDVAGAISVQVV
jgi:hypothetical protein